MSNQVIHQLSDEAYADLCWRASKYEDLKAELEQIRAEIEDLEPSCNFEGFYKCQSEVIEIIDKAIKEQSQLN